MLRSLLKSMLPARLVLRIQERRNRNLNARVDSAYGGSDAGEVFSKVYSEGVWGKGEEFFSGSGSRREDVLQPYISSVSQFLDSLPSKPNAVDLGCGDFYVGSKLRPHCAKYTACDVVPSMLDHHRAKFESLDVDFQCVDISRDRLPPGDVAFIRQVLQHLDNVKIAEVVAKLKQYRHVIVTEAIPARRDFVPNVDKLTGPGTRIATASGVVLTARPFSLAPADERPLCVVQESASLLVTTLYRMY